MQLNRDQFMEEGYLVLREVVPPAELEDLRAGYERMVDRQRGIWSCERNPDDPPGGVWETGAQPRLMLHRPPLVDLIDTATANTAEIWLHKNLQGVSTQLMREPDAGVTEMMMMCSPVRDRGPAVWHRDIHPIDTAPLQAYIDDIMENGPRYVQWNIPLYDDSVLWVVPGSHRRINTDEENRQLLADPRVPLPGAVQTHLNGGDGVVYITPILHWGSNYSAKLRRTIHGGFCNFTKYEDLSYTKHLSTEAQATLKRWDTRSEQMQDHTESALRAVIEKSGSAYHAALEEIHPGRGEKGKMLTTIFLCKAAFFINLHRNPDLEDGPEDLRRRGTSAHPTTLNWGPEFADRFTAQEADALWKRFKPLDAKLQRDEEHFFPGFQSGPMHYCFNETPADFGVTEFIASWES